MKIHQKLSFVALLCALPVLPANANSEICRTPEGFLDQMQSASIAEDGGGDEDEKGIGGTGKPYTAAYVTGTVYAHGSICVNGLRVSYKKDQAVSDGRHKYPADKLKLGQVVTVRAQRIPGTPQLVATSITADNLIQGPITKLSPGKNLIYVMEQPVQIKGRSKVIFAEGQRVTISGLIDKHGTVVASLIEPAKAGEKDYVVNTVKRRKDNNLYAGYVPLAKYSPSEDLKKMAAVKIEGLWSQGKLQASKTDQTAEKVAFSTKAYYSFEGYVNKVGPGNHVRLNGQDVVARSMTCGGHPLEEGERLIGMGSIDAQGNILIDGFADQFTPATNIAD